MKRLVIFASGAGSNAREIIRFFESNPKAEVVLVISSHAHAGVLDIAGKYGISAHVLDKKTFSGSQSVVDLLVEMDVDLIVLAGFLWKVPEALIKRFPNKIINIHPALLPLYGGKGMYGMHVHRAVVAAKETQTGITIHYVNENYDEGKVIFQASCPISDTDTPEAVAAKVHRLEHANFAHVIDGLLKE